MKSTNIAFASLLAAASLGFSGAVAGQPHTDRAPPPAAVQLERKKRRQQAAGVLRVRAPRKRGPGWTQAHVQRMATKRRNQRRHRTTCKRRGRQ